MPDNQSVEPLLDLRLAYLRAVAKSWEDEDYRKQLLTAPDIQPMLIAQGMKAYWPNLQFKIFNDPDPARQTHWDPMQTAGWVGRDDAFEIALPQPPKDPTQGAIALAAYYQIFPDVMGPMGPPPVNTPGGGLGAVDPGLGIPGGGPDSLLAFGGVILRAIALAWHDPTFKAQLLTTAPDAEPVLSQWFGYNNPFNFIIRFKDALNLTWNGTSWDGLADAPAGVERVTNAIVLNYPIPPQDGGLRPIALTAYNNTGPAYPFTC